MDTNQDGVLTREETLAEARNAFAAYDTSKSGIITLEALSSGRQARSAMGGFIREHREELDRNNDGAVSLEEVLSNAARMFDKADSDGDHRLPITASMKELSPKRDSRGKPDQAPTTSTSSTTPASTPTRLPTAKTGSTTPPNIIFILVDDLGWRDAGFTGNTFVETPNVDQLAHEGIHFTQAYSSAPNCAPTRACLMSGQYPPRHGIFTVIDPRHDPGQTHHKVLGSTSQEALDGEVITIAEVLKSAGYSTACFGMWNLGRGRSGPSTPTGQGFDVYKGPRELGFPQNEYFASDGRYLTHALFDEGLRFMEEHRDSPFFLYLAPHAIHSPFEPRPELLAYYQEKARKHTGEKVDPVHAAMVTAVDQEVGRLMTHLCERQLDENTLVVFTSDNGGTPQYVAPLNGSKGALYEGGIRVPCAVWWKGIHSPGRNSDLPILSMDFYPTLAEIAGALLPVNQPTDGISLLPILQNTGIPSREAVFWHFPCYIGRGEPTSAMRAGNWKLIEKFETGAIELYDLSQDPGETHNLTSLKPEQASRLTARLHAWQNQLQAPRPTQPNPAYDPTAVPQRKPRGNSPPKLGKRGKTQRQGS